MIKPSTSRVLSALLALSGASAALDGVVLAPSALSRTTSAVELRLRRSPGRVDVVIAGIGTEVRAVSQNQSDGRWSARLTGVDLGDRPFTPQQMVLPSSELLSVRLEPLESDLQLIVQARMGERVPKPTIGANGESLVVSFAGLTGPEQRSSSRLDLRRPSRVSQPMMAPPMRPRAVAPPLGDMAVGTMLVSNKSFIKLSGPKVSLNVRGASAIDTLRSISRLGKYGFVYVDDKAVSLTVNSSGQASVSGQGAASSGTQSSSLRGSGAAQASSTATASILEKGVPIDLYLVEEDYSRAFNSVLIASNLQARLDGQTIFVGPQVLDKTFGPQMSKVFRLNQVDAADAGRYLGNLGAEVKVTNVTTTTSRETESSGTTLNGTESSITEKSTRAEVDTYSSGSGPLVGLVGTTDSRLNTITLVGDSSLINVAQSYLKQIDLRKRQVAVKVQILNVRLENNAAIDSSFSAKIGNTFIVSESGTAHLNFGKYKPGRAQEGTGLYNGREYADPGSYPAFVPRVQAQEMQTPYIESQEVLDPYIVARESSGVAEGEEEYTEKLDELGRPEYVLDSNPNAPKQLRPRLDSQGRPIYVPDTNPNATKTAVPRFDKKGRPIYVNANDQNKFTYPNNSFYSYVESVIESANSKTIAQPTLLVQEGEKAVVRSGLNVITGVNKTESPNGSTSFSNTREDAGLTVELEVEKIDDNGFITLKLDPTIAVPVFAGIQEGFPISDINKRELKSGRIRLRDQQTLILTGVIQEDDRETVRKWPLLGDLPLIGQLFRKSSSNRQKNELVVIVTPSILDDDNGGMYGYGYRPGTKEATRIIGSGSDF